MIEIEARPDSQQKVSYLLDTHFGKDVVRYAADSGIKAVITGRRKYKTCSSALRRLGVDVDSWPVPPTGLFVVEEKTLYVKKITALTVVHEFGHALDCALGGGIYYSGRNPEIRNAYATARDFVTPYAACGLDEYFAESVRAFVEVNETGFCGWPDATKARLKKVDPTMYEIIQNIFDGLRGH